MVQLVKEKPDWNGDQFRFMTGMYLSAVTNVYGAEAIQTYSHILHHHVGEVVDEYGSIAIFCMLSLESLHLVTKCFVDRCTNKTRHGNIALSKTVINDSLVEKRLMYNEDLKNEINRYLKFDLPDLMEQMRRWDSKYSVGQDVDVCTASGLTATDNLKYGHLSFGWFPATIQSYSTATDLYEVKYK
ncbi:hypothetical protein SAMD00019534_036290 [Acytostelium subglobosum LB1]|uniref:hypothetical protein n=1 Tax=Acytostelium subglobosum LB1 TaxID=1410327 RepID=UPI0006449996|nr:hypothetical protein SAMD00019534_036290 [Acytostelium subglobosum LB1]GAM20454.1 hypothetical protein SAMD00019534_036290 [Acytostelium subglobosum LB1]|eukprot:XP_012759975.1 hypothetical protein SAMD00019534_036290 [Acytostelium subglobosum LB1]